VLVLGRFSRYLAWMVQRIVRLWFISSGGLDMGLPVSFMYVYTCTGVEVPGAFAGVLHAYGKAHFSGNSCRGWFWVSHVR
jgi:hypothetical protein